MKKIAKMAVGLAAVAMAASAFAGGPEMAPPTINGFNFGLGFGYKSYSFGNLRVDQTVPIWLVDHGEQANKFGPIGEIGYTFQVSNFAFIGLRGYWEYDNSVAAPVPFVSHTYEFSLQSHLAAMFLAGLLLNSSNAVYLEAGYTAMWGKTTVRAYAAPGGSATAIGNYTLSGGIAGIGWRHYFINNVYLDLSYDFALYADNNTNVTSPADSAGRGPATAGGIRKLQVNGITATLNYLFKV